MRKIISLNYTNIRFKTAEKIILRFLIIIVSLSVFIKRGNFTFLGISKKKITIPMTLDQFQKR